MTHVRHVDTKATGPSVAARHVGRSPQDNGVSPEAGDNTQPVNPDGEDLRMEPNHQGEVTTSVSRHQGQRKK